MAALDSRKDNPRPFEIYWYVGWVNKEGQKSEVSMSYPVCVISYPAPPKTPGGPIRIFVQHTPGKPATTGWINLKELGERVVNPEPPKG